MANVIDESKETKLIFSPNVARALLKLGNTIVDIKPNKENKQRTVFVFKNDEHFRNSFNEAVKEKENVE